LYDHDDFVNVNLISYNEAELRSRAIAALRRLKVLQKAIVVNGKIG
jgi:hypothetical protein